MSKTHYFVLDCFPPQTSKHFHAFTGAIAGCWVSASTSSTTLGALTHAARKMRDEGWTVAACETNEIVCADDYAINPDGEEFFRQALEDGFAAHIQVRAREVFGHESIDAETLLSAYPAALQTFRAAQGYSLYSTEDEQWANGTTPSGDEFLPVWADEASARLGSKDWPGYGLRAIQRDELRAGFLRAVDESKMWIGLGLQLQSFVTFHPLALRRDLRAE